MSSLRLFALLSHSSLSGQGSSKCVSLGYSAQIELSFSGFSDSTSDYHLLTKIYIPSSRAGVINDFICSFFFNLKKLSFFYFLKMLS